MGAPGLSLVDQSRLSQRLARGDLQALSPLAPDRDFRKARQVLPHVEHQKGVVTDGVFHAIMFHDLHRLGYLLSHHPSRRFLNDDGLPVSLSFEPCIIILAAIDAVESNRTEPIPPRSITDNVLHGTVMIGHRHIEPQRRRTEGDTHLGIPAALLVVETVAQQHAEGVFAFLQHGCHIVDVIEHRLIIVAP